MTVYVKGTHGCRSLYTTETNQMILVSLFIRSYSVLSDETIKMMTNLVPLNPCKVTKVERVDEPFSWICWYRPGNFPRRTKSFSLTSSHKLKLLFGDRYSFTDRCKNNSWKQHNILITDLRPVEQVESVRYCFCIVVGLQLYLFYLATKKTSCL